MSRFAQSTRVPVEQTRNEIERTLARYGATGFAYFNSLERSMIAFEASGRRIMFELPLPISKQISDEGKRNQVIRQRWRALLLVIKAKLEAVESKITTFEDEFMAHIVMPDGQTVSTHLRPRIAEAYESGNMPPLLPAPGGHK